MHIKKNAGLTFVQSPQNVKLLYSLLYNCHAVLPVCENTADVT